MSSCCLDFRRRLSPHTRRTHGVFAILAAACSLSLGAPPLSAREETFDVEGFVVDATNASVPGATVSLEGTEIAARTDSLGGFVLRGVPKGEHSVTARLGCIMTGHIDAMRVPRPVRVPLPIRLQEIDCGEASGLAAADQHALASLAVRWFSKEDRRTIVSMLLSDGAIRLLDGGNLSIDDVALGEAQPVPVEHLNQDSAFPEAIWLSLCISVGDARTAFVRIVRSSPPVPEELDVFIGDAALITFTRENATAEWHLARQLVCVDAHPSIEAGASTQTTD